MQQESRGKTLRELLEEGDSSDEAGVFPEMPCVLKERRPCCRGRGYRVRPLGAYAHAELCVCVQSCASCLGKAQKFFNNSVRPCRMPSPRRVVNLYNNAKIPSRYSGAHTGVFRNMTGNCLHALQSVRKWLHEFPHMQEKKGLILTGPVGVGKTYMLTAMAKALTEKGVSVRFVDFFQLISQIKSAYAENKSEQAILSPLLQVEVLIIDELGKGRNTEFEATVLDQLVMNRYNENKILVASTNLSVKKSVEMTADSEHAFSDYSGSLEQRVGPRIYSRLLETTLFVEMDGKDFRLQDLKK